MSKCDHASSETPKEGGMQYKRNKEEQTMKMMVKDPQMKTLLERLFEGHEVRLSRDENDDLWFVGKDVCECLEIKFSRNAIRALQADETRRVLVDGKRCREDSPRGVIVNGERGDRVMTLVSESGLYRLIFRSRKPVAERFRTWIAREVLPSIRKHGIYEGGTAALADRKLTAAAYKELRGIGGTSANGVSQRARHWCILLEDQAQDCHRGKLYPVYILDKACACLVARTGALCGGPAIVQLELL